MNEMREKSDANKVEHTLFCVGHKTKQATAAAVCLHKVTSVVHVRKVDGCLGIQVARHGCEGWRSNLSLQDKEPSERLGGTQNEIVAIACHALVQVAPLQVRVE